jgi:signal recognition particle subunit SRP54
MIGQDAVETAQAFHEGVDFTGVVLSKLDGDARGGAALSVALVTGRPILFASTGEGVKDFEVFHPDRMASRILDMGDILTLIEQAQKAFDKQPRRRRWSPQVPRRPRTSPSTTSSSRWRQIKQDGLASSRCSGCCRACSQMRAQLDAFDEKRVRPGRGHGALDDAVRAQATPSRSTARAGVSASPAGRACSVSEVNQLLERFTEAQKMMKSLARGGGPGLPGMPGMPGMRKGKAAPPPRKKAKSGNPAKRAAEERALADRATTGRQEAAGRAFGMPPGAGGASGAPGAADLDPSKLPPGFEKFLGR